MSTLGMVGEPADALLCLIFLANLAYIVYLVDSRTAAILRELRKQSEGKGKDGGK